MIFPQLKEWLCLNCQMQRALTAAESADAPLMKPKATNKASSVAAAPKDSSDDQKKDVIPGQEAEVPENQGMPKPAPPQKKEEIKTTLQMNVIKTSTTALLPAEKSAISASTTEKVEKISAPPINNGSISTEPPTKQMATAVSENKEEKAEIVQKSPKELMKLSSDVQPQQDPKPVEKSPATSVPPASQPQSQESGGFFSFGSPKSQRAGSQTTEAVTEKMLGFGSSIFSSASTLITSAVKEEPHKTPPSSRKMSAPAQVSGKASASPKPSPPVSPRMIPAKGDKIPAAPMPHAEKPPDQIQRVIVSPTEHNKIPVKSTKPEASQTAPKVRSSTCPLCKVELSVDSKDPTNYNTCTECKTTVCNKCGFSPMQNVTQVMKSSNTNTFITYELYSKDNKSNI